ncbi:MAG: hypothetical protein CVV27_14730 [Candidatus Melainabacteria bacterium HGW-Melainabacteria-1]|nr:MAG: hypothetical protein CVV27_14730 [Candidatus Melainabacteria bacterium HGW-Melainabacteria-1]
MAEGLGIVLRTLILQINYSVFGGEDLWQRYAIPAIFAGSVAGYNGAMPNLLPSLLRLALILTVALTALGLVSACGTDFESVFGADGTTANGAASGAGSVNSKILIRLPGIHEQASPSPKP